MNAPSGLDVVIVSYRCEDLLRDCLASLREHAPKAPMTVFVVDNASNDGTVDMVREEFPEARLIASDENVGFSAANNMAIRQGGAPYVLVLNPDTRMTPGTLDRLLELMDERRDVGICGCRLELEDGTFDHAAKRSFPTPLGALAHFTGIGRWSRAPKALAQYRAPEVDEGPVDAVNGAFMLMRRRMLDEVGLFDEGYWMYMEDLDLCYRAKQAGWITWYAPAAFVIHVKHGSSGARRPPRLVYAFHRGMYRFYRLHYAGKHSHMMRGCIYLGIGLKLAAAVAHSAGLAGLRDVRERLPIAPRAAA